MPNSTESILDYRVTMMMIMLAMMSRWTEMIIMITRVQVDRNDNNDNQVDINHLREEDTFYLPAETGISHRRHHFWPEMKSLSSQSINVYFSSNPNPI